MKKRLFLISFIIGNFIYSQEIESSLKNFTQLLIENNYELKSQNYTIQESKSYLLSNYGVFDFGLTSNVSYNYLKSRLQDNDPKLQYLNSHNLRSNNVGFSAGIQKKLQSGQYTNVSIDYTFDNNNFPINNFGENVGEYANNNFGRLLFSLTQPILRGRGKNINLAPIHSIEANITSLENQYSYISSYQLFQMAVAYWDYLKSYKQLEVYKENEERVNQIFLMTNELIKADKKPASELIQVEAQYLEQQKLTEAAELAFQNSKVNLAIIIGIDEEKSNQIKNPKDDFPNIENSGYYEEIKLESLVELAIANRKDLEASKSDLKSLEFQKELQQNDLKPQLDVTGFLSYGGQNTGYGIVSPFYQVQGQNIGAGVQVQFSYPIENRIAKGNFKRTSTLIENQKVVNENIERTIELDLKSSLNTLERSVSILEKSKKTLEAYKEAYNNENTKFQNGLTTLINLLIFQDRLANAELEYIRAKQGFANSIVNIRFYSGTILSDNGNSNEFEKVFYELPLF